jgi:hypothetical protein
MLGEPQQAHRDDVDDGGAQGDVEKGPHEEKTAHRQRTHDPRNEAQLEPGAAETDDGAGRRRGELAREVRGDPPHDPVHEQGRPDPAARDPEGGSRRVKRSPREHGAVSSLQRLSRRFGATWT